jgi:hypothetical protein
MLLSLILTFAKVPPVQSAITVPDFQDLARRLLTFLTSPQNVLRKQYQYYIEMYGGGDKLIQTCLGYIYPAILATQGKEMNKSL